MSDEDPPYRRVLLFGSTLVYGAVFTFVLASFVAGFEGTTLWEYTGIGVLFSIPVSWWLAGRPVGFQGFDPGNLAFLLVILIVSVVGLPVLADSPLGDSVVAILGVILVALAGGRIAERRVTAAYGQYWGGEVETVSSEDDETTEEDGEQTADTESVEESENDGTERASDAPKTGDDGAGRGSDGG